PVGGAFAVGWLQAARSSATAQSATMLILDGSFTDFPPVDGALFFLAAMTLALVSWGCLAPFPAPTRPAVAASRRGSCTTQPVSARGRFPNLSEERPHQKLRFLVSLRVVTGI